eukprot:jgi/Mesvir1/17445/Mv08721-RA.1
MEAPCHYLVLIIHTSLPLSAWLCVLAPLPASYWPLCFNVQLAALCLVLSCGLHHAVPWPGLPVGQCQGVRLNQITVVGAHNSYHVAPPKAAMDLLYGLYAQAADWNMTMPPLEQQLDDGMRVLELDVLYDPLGGRFNFSNILSIATGSGVEPGPDMNVPGFKVGHVPDADFRTTCRLLTTCLSSVRQWSLQNPRHLPLVIYLEYKTRDLYSQFVDEMPDGAPNLLLELIQLVKNLPSNPLPASVEAVRALEQEVLSLFPRDAILTPDDVRGSHVTLEDAILKHGWPLVDDVRGKVIFVLIQFDARASYHNLTLQGGNATLLQAQSLYGRPFFTAPRPGDPDAAFVTDLWSVDNNTALVPLLRSMVERGYIIRQNTEAGRTDPNPARKAALFAAGVQQVVSDYLPNTMQSLRYTPTFVGATLPGAPCASAICNPVTSSAIMCNSADVGDFVNAFCREPEAGSSSPPPREQLPSPHTPPPPPHRDSSSSSLTAMASWVTALLAFLTFWALWTMAPRI